VQAQATVAANFIQKAVEQDLASGRCTQVVTGFAVEPDGYLHLGHAKAIALSFELAQRWGGVCHLRMDDTNPVSANPEFESAIRRDMAWLGYDWGGRESHALDHFEKLYELALQLIQAGKAYVCDLSPEEMRAYRGSLSEPGRNSPYRNRSAEENRELLRRMRAGEFADHSRTLRAKIDMASPNLNLRDPALYRVRRLPDPRPAEKGSIYPMHDFAHMLCDALEGITHSLTTLEFENHRPLYDWLWEHLSLPRRPQQLSFSRLRLQRTLLRKRACRELIAAGVVEGWDDPRLPTLAGLRRRGCPPEALRDFCQRVGVTRSQVWTELAYLEQCLREHLNVQARRAMAVLQPLKVVLSNYPEGSWEELELADFPEDVGLPGTRRAPFGRELYIEQADFREDAPEKYRRLVPGGEVRLRRAYIIRCQDVVRDLEGRVVELRCTYDPSSRSGTDAPRRVGTIHWVEASTSIGADVRLYNPLFAVDQPEGLQDCEILAHVNPESRVLLTGARLERSLAEAEVGQRFQFERQGYFVKDQDSTSERAVFNRIVPLKDRWAKQASKSGGI